MKWIALVILLIVVPYTFVRWHYRKPNRAFEPYHDMKDRANTMRLLSAGFQRVTLEADRPADPVRLAETAAVAPAPGGLPPVLSSSLVDAPLLPLEILSVSAPPAGNPMFSYPISLTCTIPDHKRQLGGAHLYAREQDIYIVPFFEPLDGALLARSRESQIRLTVPPGALKPGRYHVTLIGARASKAWSLEIR